MCVVDDDGDAAVGIEAEEPVFLLFVGHDVAVKIKMYQLKAPVDFAREYARLIHECSRPFSAVDFVKLFKHDLDLLAVGRALGD